MRSYQFLFILCVLCSFSLNAQTVVWQDDFSGPVLNQENWAYDFGDGCERGNCGWGNAELEYYTSRTQNVRIDTGNLVIEARRESFQGKQFTSGRIKTFGRVQFKYGILEARIKVPNLKNGLWPAFWMLGTKGQWPASGEIDIMEMGMASSYPDNVNKWVSSATHWQNNGTLADYGTLYKSPIELDSNYHTYKMIWTSTYIHILMDNTQIYSINTTGADMEEFHKPQYILLNFAVGGSFTGIPAASGITATMPAQMLVDYIKLTQSPGDELYIGKDHAPVDNYGVFTETTPVVDSLTYGTDANLYYWNNLTNITGAVPYEGSSVLAVSATANNWFGFGVENDNKYMVNYANGSLRFNFKTTYQGQFKVGVKSGHGESWINFPIGVSNYGLVRDGNWHEVSIPLSAFDQPNLGMHIDLGSMNSLFMFAGDPPGNNTEFYFDNIYYTPCVSGVCPLLPVKLSDYAARQIEGKKVLVSWATLTEQNSDHFTIERGSNGNTFESIGTVRSNKNGLTGSKYSFTDKNPFIGTNYYRLVQVDVDGKKTYYDTKQVTLANNNGSASIYPNPVKGQRFDLTFGQPFNQDINVQVMDLTGKAIPAKFEKATENKITVNLISKPAAGLYLVKVDGKVVSKLLIE